MYRFQASVFSFIVGSSGGGRRVDFGIGCSRPEIRMLRRVSLVHFMFLFSNLFVCGYMIP